MQWSDAAIEFSNFIFQQSQKINSQHKLQTSDYLLSQDHDASQSQDTPTPVMAVCVWDYEIQFYVQTGSRAANAVWTSKRSILWGTQM